MGTEQKAINTTTDFLDRVAGHILQNHPGGMEKVCVILPTRRGSQVFKQRLAQQVSKPTLAPQITAISDFISSNSDTKIGEEIELVFLLYTAYSKFLPGEKFDKFYPWGRVLLSDFDEIDRNLKDPSHIFTTLKELEALEAAFAPDIDDIGSLKAFWESFTARELTHMRMLFLKTWKELKHIYLEFEKLLAANNITYEGAVYKKLARSGLRQNDEFAKIYFCGFYALSASEEKLFGTLVDAGMAEILWDYDQYYLDNPLHEAGAFLRKSTLLKNNTSWGESYFATVSKNIEVCGVPLVIGQAKYAGSIVNDILAKKENAAERTAVILPNESLLMPILHALPPGIENLNITMGYPLKDTPHAHLVDAVQRLHENHLKSGARGFYYKDVLQVLTNPLIHELATNEVDNLANTIAREGMVFITEKKINNTSLPTQVKALFETPLNFESLFTRLLGINNLLLQTHHAAQDLVNAEIAYRIHGHISTLHNTLSKFKNDFEIGTITKLLKEIISKHKVPFSGEPLQGLQIMGFLESRVLDFDTIIILSVNEGVLPSSQNKISYIPHSVRKAYRLPTQDERDAVTAYHFYRLLQRARNIYLIHDTEVKKILGGERSRFLLQIELELAKKFPDTIHLTKKIITTPLTPAITAPITIQKSEKVLNILSKYQISDNNEKPRLFSASALINYITCPLQFYFNYIAGIKPDEGITENLDAIPFGNVLHRALHILYTETNILTVESKQVNELLKTSINQALSEEFTQTENILKGKNALLKQVIEELAGRIVDQDRNESNLEIVALEYEVKAQLQLGDQLKVGLRGVVDRIDKHFDTLRIVDYKTGQAEVPVKLDLDKIFAAPKFKSSFQAMLYTWMVNNDGTYPGPYQAGIYALKKINYGILLLKNGGVIEDIDLTEFETRLKMLIGEIMNPEIAFTQTSDETRCKQCPYNLMCNR